MSELETPDLNVSTMHVIFKSSLSKNLEKSLEINLLLKRSAVVLSLLDSVCIAPSSSFKSKVSCKDLSQVQQNWPHGKNLGWMIRTSGEHQSFPVNMGMNGSLVLELRFNHS